MMRDFMQGLTFWWIGWRYIYRERSLAFVALAPLLIAASSTVLLVWVLWSYLPLWVQQLISTLLGVASGFWYTVLYYPIVFGGGILVFIATVYVIYIFHSFVAVPFYSLLAERTLNQIGKRRIEAEPIGRWIKRSVGMLKVTAIKAILLLMIGAILFVFSFLPMLNLIAIFGALMILAFDCMDYSFEAMGYGFRKRVRYLFRERAQWMGMAAGLGLTLLLPGLTLLVIPGAVVGAGLVLKDSHRDTSSTTGQA